MTNGGSGDTYTTVTDIPAQADGTKVYYLITATDDASESTSPAEQVYTVSDPNITTLPYENTFDTGLGDCINVTVTGNKPWVHQAGSATGNAYSGLNPEEHWLVLPGIDFDSYGNESMSFKTSAKLGPSDENSYLKLYYSNNYLGVGSPYASGVTWEEVPFTLPVGFSPSLETSAQSMVDLSGKTGTNGFLAFKYYSNSTSVQWRIDDILISEVTSPLLTVNPTTLSGFTYVEGEAPGTAQTVAISGLNLSPAADNVTVSGSTNYEVSMDDVTFSASVQIAYTGGALVDTDVYVRLKAGLNVGDYNGEIVQIIGGTATPVEVTCSGTVTTPPQPAATFADGGYVEDFSGFEGTGFSANPSATQLHSENWRVEGFKAVNGVFGGEHTTTTFAQGLSAGGVTAGGVYAFEVGSGGKILGFQATGNDLKSGNVTLKLENTTGSLIESLEIYYDIYVYNNEPRSSNFNFAYSSDDVVYIPVGELDYATPLAADDTPTWTPVERSSTISGLTFANGDFIYLQWQISDNGGSGARDEFGITDIIISEGAAPAPTHAVNYSVVSANGTLLATVDAAEIATGDVVEEGKTVVFTATPDAGYRVKEWTLNTVAVVGNTTNNYSLENLAAEATVTVEFEEIPPVLYAVNFSVVGANGTISATVDASEIATGDEVLEGKNVVFTATPDAGYRVKEWKKNTEPVVGNSTNNYTITALSEASNVSVEFELIPTTTYIVTFNVVGGNGTLTAISNEISLASGDPVFEGDDIAFTAIPDAGFRVKEWTLQGVIVDGNITNSYTVSAISAATTVTVEFEAIPTYEVLFSVVGGNGTLTATVDEVEITNADMIPETKDVLFTATPDAGYRVKTWTLDGVAVDGNTTVNYSALNLSANVNVTVEFEIILSTAAEMVTFSFAEQASEAIIGDGTIAIKVVSGTPMNNLVATFTVSDGATVKIGEVAQESGVTTNDFTNVLTYVITAEDGTTTKNWDVTVTEAAPEATAILPIEVYSGPWSSISETGWAQSGLGSDYSGARAKFDSEGDWLKVHFDSNPGMLTCFLKGNTAAGSADWDGTFTIEESSNGNDWTSVHSF
ncbi:MAG: choice-of-anchor J domain-containing protein, partial [Salinivirgaceae bacterium]|nr:choice-of-anchor J domain-containing protein [Salinivirgaceae bacterium]